MKNLTLFVGALTMLSFTIPTTTYAGKHDTAIREFWTAVDKGNFEKAISYLAADLQVIIPLSAEPLSRDAFRQLGEGFRVGFPDIRHNVQESTEGKKTTAVRGIFSGTNTGSLMGNPATGNRVELPFLQYWTFDAEGKAIRIEIAFDLAAFNTQLMKGLPNPKLVAEKNIRELYKIMDAGQTEKFALFCAPNFIISNPLLPAPAPIKAFQGVIQTQKTAFPDMKHEVLEIISDGNTVVTKGIFSGTNTGKMMDNPPTGNRVELPFLVLDQLDASGKIVNRHVQFDSKSFESQLMKGIPAAKNQASELALKMMAKLDAHDLKGAIQYCAADARFNGWGPQTLDSKGYNQAMTEILASFPDARFKITDVVAEGDKVVVRHQLEGTHTGAAFQGIPKSKRKVVVPATVTFYFNDGKAQELWLNADMLGLLMQLGANPMAKN